MREFIKLMLFASLCFSPIFSAEKALSEKEIADKVEQLLRKMTLEEKVGQMNQITLAMILKDGQRNGTYHELDEKKLRFALLEKHVGSILNVQGSALTVDNWHDVINKIQHIATEETRLKIPIIYGIDAIHGANYTIGATIFPQNIAMAATWNPELIRKSAEITAIEVRASGIPWNFNPVLGIGRQPLWPRLYETFGEEPYLVSVMAHEYVKGMEGENNEIFRDTQVASCVKHYLGYSVPRTGRDRTPAYIPKRQLYEYILPSFKAGIDAGAHTLMINSGEINGEPIHASHYYLTELLRDELGFEGFAVSDWADVSNLFTREHVATNYKDATRISVMAGMDMAMTPMDYEFGDHLIELVKEGTVPESRIDEAVGRILRVKVKLGLFDRATPKEEWKKRIGTEEATTLNIAAAEESITLLKNEANTLPIQKGKKILITGPAADKLSALNGGWTITWQGGDEALYPKDKLTFLEAMQNRFGKENVSFHAGASFDTLGNIDEVVEAAKNADVAVLCLGEHPYAEVPGNIRDLSLPEAQIKLAQAVQATGTPTVLVMIQGRPRIIRPLVEEADAIVMAFLPGMEGGTALTNILDGTANPSGKLPITYPRYVNDLTLYDHKHSENTSSNQADSAQRFYPQFNFGYGLSYTNFTYSDLKLADSTFAMDAHIPVSVTVKNTGDRAGKEVVQLYLSDLVASVTPHNKRLKKFTKIQLAPGESKEVTFTLSKEDLSFIGLENKPVVEAGTFRVQIAGLSEEFDLVD